MHEKTLRVPESVLEQLQCISCRGYLSCSPLRVLSDGTQCGRCVSSDGYRAVALEVILNIFSFPCVFDQRGCKQLLRFNAAQEHETECPYRSFNCPLTSTEVCKWTGSSSDFLGHFKREHCGYIWKKPEFKLDVEETSRGTFMYVQENTGFLIRYAYNNTGHLLRYEICYCSSQSLSSSYKMQLFNDQDHDCSISLKSHKCKQYSEQALDLQNAICLNLQQYLKNLEGPSALEVVLSLHQKPISPDTSLVNYNVLNSLKCGDCCNYLIPPVYDLDEHTLCSDCGKRNPHCSPSNNERIKMLVADVCYPCRWRECKDVVRSEHFKKHELNCEYRHYDCFFPTCKVTFKIDSAIEHLQSHRATYVTDSISYKTKFDQLYSFKHLFTVKENVITVIQHNVVESDDNLVHRIALFSSNPAYVMGNVDFEHEHCKLKSRLFLLVSDHNTDVNLSQLPPCFKKDDELLVTVSILGSQAVPTLKDVAVPAWIRNKKVEKGV